MNIFQKIVLIIGLLLLFVILLFFTPYNHYWHIVKTNPLSEVKQLQGTSFGNFFLPPFAKEGKTFFKKPLRLPNYDDNGAVKPLNLKERMEDHNATHTVNANVAEVDYPRLITFILIVVLVTCVLIPVFNNSNRKKR